MVSPGRQAPRERPTAAISPSACPKAAELVAADLRRQIICGELAAGRRPAAGIGPDGAVRGLPPHAERSVPRA